MSTKLLNKIPKVFPEKLEHFFNEIEEPKNDYENVVGQDSINRFDKGKRKAMGGFYKRKKKKTL